MSSHNHTSKKKNKQHIADGGLFASMALDMPVESAVQYQMELPIPQNGTGDLRQRYIKSGFPDYPVVYFVQEKSPVGFIKIGYATHLSDRLSSIRTANAYGARLLGFIGGDKTLESLLHDQFRECRYRGEWFYPEQKLLAYIKNKCDKLGKSSYAYSE